MSTKKEEKAGNRNLAILMYYVKNGPVNKYRVSKDVSRKLDVSQNTILYSILDFERDGLIEVDHQEHGSRGRDGTSDYYDLTLRGISQLLAQLNPDKSASIVDSIAEKYGRLLPGIFASWPHLNAVGLSELARLQLQNVAKTLDNVLEPTALYEAVKHVTPLHTEEPTPQAIEEFRSDRLAVVYDRFWQSADSCIHCQEEWFAGLRRNPVLWSAAVQHIVTGCERGVRHGSWILKQLGASESKAEALQESELREVRNRLKMYEAEIVKTSELVRRLNKAFN